MGQSPKQKDKGSWRNDEFAAKEVASFWGWVLIPLIAFLAATLFPAFNAIKAKSKTVILYAAQDQVYAEPILREFEKETGIKVKAVYDSEAVKTVGLANRLLAERSHPQCDVFWGNEEMRTRQLAAQGVFRETNGWATFGYRSRRFVINTNFVSLRSRRGNEADQTSSTLNPPPHVGGYDAPTSLLDLTNEIWRGKIALAFPQFGTTATHLHALKQLWGEERWLAWCRALAANKPFVVDGNSVVVKFVSRGEAWIGLTDSDDIAAGQREGLPIAALPFTEESLLIPNTVAVIRNAPHPEAAQRLFEYLQRREVAEKLVQASALESASAGRRRGDESQAEKKLEPPYVVSYGEIESLALNPDWDSLLRDLDATTKHLNEIFLR